MGLSSVQNKKHICSRRKILEYFISLFSFSLYFISLFNQNKTVYSSFIVRGCFPHFGFITIAMIHFSISVFLGQSLTARDPNTSFLQSSLSTLHKSQLTAGTGAFYNESQHNVTVTERLCCWEGYSTKKSTSQVLSASLSAPSRTGWVATG